MSMITEQIKRLRDLADDIFKKGCADEMTCRVELREAADTIEMLSEKARGGKWIPVKFRPLTEEEEIEYPDYCYMADCQMPSDEEEILISTVHGTVEKDIAVFDDAFYLDSGYDWQTDVVAWMPLPEPYRADMRESEDTNERL